MVDGEGCAAAPESSEVQNVNTSYEMQLSADNDGAADLSGGTEYLTEYLDQSSETVDDADQLVEIDGAPNALEQQEDRRDVGCGLDAECLEASNLSQNSFKMEEMTSSLNEYYSEDSDVVEVLSYYVYEDENETA